MRSKVFYHNHQYLFHKDCSVSRLSRAFHTIGSKGVGGVICLYLLMNQHTQHFSVYSRGSKITIRGRHLDSVYRTIVRFNPNESHLKPVHRVRAAEGTAFHSWVGLVQDTF